MGIRMTALTRDARIQVPIICGAMYPCSNPELVAAASQAGAIGIVQPLSMTYVHGHDLRAGLGLIRRLTDRPIGRNALMEGSSRRYRRRMERWVEIALEGGPSAGWERSMPCARSGNWGGPPWTRVASIVRPFARTLSK
jgi:NAD(P)H-dependent flavin oxidoreductase YrpB (nitropropane dioxygenase family)